MELIGGVCVYCTVTQRMWKWLQQFIKREKSQRYEGKDYQGNKYYTIDYDSPHSSNNNTNTATHTTKSHAGWWCLHRTTTGDHKTPHQLLTLLRVNTLPPAWRMWLYHHCIGSANCFRYNRRPDPPTEQEVLEEKARIEVYLERARKWDEKEARERLEEQQLHSIQSQKNEDLTTDDPALLKLILGQSLLLILSFSSAADRAHRDPPPFDISLLEEPEKEENKR